MEEKIVVKETVLQGNGRPTDDKQKRIRYTMELPLRELIIYTIIIVSFSIKESTIGWRWSKVALTKSGHIKT